MALHHTGYCRLWCIVAIALIHARGTNSQGTQSGIETSSGHLGSDGNSTGTRGGNASNRTYPPCEDSINNISTFYSVFLVFVIVITVLGNSLVCFSVYKSPVLRERPTNLFLVSLAVSDIMVALLTLPIKLKQALDNQLFCMNETTCWLLYLTDVTFSVASVTNLVVIATDRFIAITRPYRYGVYLSRQRAKFIIALVWIYSLFWSALSIFKWHEPESLSTSVQAGLHPYCINDNRIYFTTIYGCVFVLPLMAITVMYAAILKVAVKQIKAITSAELNRTAGRRRRELRATRTVAIVFGVFVVCWLPACVISLSSLWLSQHYLELQKRNRDLFLGIYMTFIQVLPPLNSTANPFIYAIFNRNFRSAFKRVLLRSFFKETRAHNIENSICTQSRNDLDRVTEKSSVELDKM